jgi:hypothetical protein
MLTEHIEQQRIVLKIAHPFCIDSIQQRASTGVLAKRRKRIDNDRKSCWMFAGVSTQGGQFNVRGYSRKSLEQIGGLRSKIHQFFMRQIKLN